MMTAIEMETRQCGCGLTFRVMKASPQKYHASHCNGMRAHGEPLKPLNENDKKPVSVNVSVTPMTKHIEKKLCFDNEFHRKRKEKIEIERNEKNTNSQSENKMQNELNVQEKIGTSKMPINANGGQEIKTENLPNLKTEKISETLPALSADSQKSLMKEASDSMTLLKRSANKLSERMASSTNSKEVLEFSNALAHTIQTQVNVLKAATALLKKDK